MHDSPPFEQRQALTKNGTMLAILATVLVLCLSPLAVHAIAGKSYIIECSTVKPVASTNFQVCAAVGYATQVATPNGIFQGSLGFDYEIAQGLKDGDDASALSETERAKAFSNKIYIDVREDDDGTCVVTVGIKAKSTVCKSCKVCGNSKYAADCTNAPNGRSTKCELATPTDVYFPLTKAALPTTTPTVPVKAPVKAPVKTPVKSPVKTPVKSPVKTPVRTPIRWIVPTPVKTPVKSP